MDHISPGRIVTGDAVTLLADLGPGTVDLVVTSPPYLVGKTYEADHTEDSWTRLIADVVAGCARALRPGGFLAININDILAFSDPGLPRVSGENRGRNRHAITRQDVLAAQRADPGASRYDLARLLGCSEQTINRRLGGIGVRGGKSAIQTRVRLSGPTIERAGQAAGLYLYDRRVWVKDPSWTGSPWHAATYRAIDDVEHIFVLHKPGPFIVDRTRLTPREWASWGSRGVWNIASVRANDDHEAKFPLALPTRLIRLLSGPGELVLDPFIGSGTTAVAAIRTGRRWLGFDIDPRAADVARVNVVAAKREAS